MTRLRTALIAVLLLVVAGVVLAGCGSDSSSSSTSTPAATPAATTAAPAKTTGGASAAPAGAGVAISMKNIAFNAKDATAHVGEKVTWTNDDSVDHNVTADTGAKFASDNFGQGGTYSYTPTKVGTITYECTIHPGMTGTLNVVK